MLLQRFLEFILSLCGFGGEKEKKKQFPKSHIKSQWLVEEQEGKIQAKFMWLVAHVAPVD